MTKTVEYQLLFSFFFDDKDINILSIKKEVT